MSGRGRSANMKDVTGVWVVLLACLVGMAVGTEPSSGYCIGNECFAVFRDPEDYAGAQRRCEERGGHLMTVRSSVAHDILLILLGNATGRYWIGLRLTAGCPDPDSDLKGFQWVTKDDASDFFNWAPTFDSSCSSHRCVSVSPEGLFAWVQEPCGEPSAGFLCEYSFTQPCKGLAVAGGESVTYRTPMGFEGEDLLSLPPGSTAIRTPPETKYVCFSENWLQAPWSCEIEEGGCEYKCAVDPNLVPTCYCPHGQTLNPANKVTCEVSAQDDPCVLLRCAHTCYKTGGSYACMCDHGFKLARDGRSCVDFNDCTDDRQCPGENFACVNTVGGFQCVCQDGYKVSGDRCVDVDECVDAPCEHLCTNTPGGYECSCYPGYREDPKSPDKCELYCGEEECPAECDPNDRYQCFCPTGYISDLKDGNTVCIDIDECAFFYCDQNCRNTFGGYVCSCVSGYTLVNQYKCVKTEEDPDAEGGQEGSGTPPGSPATPPHIPTSVPVPSAPVPSAHPTRRPSGVSVGGLVGIIVCTVFFIVLVVFVAHHILSGRGKAEGVKPSEAEEAHSLRKVTSDA